MNDDVRWSAMPALEQILGAAGDQTLILLEMLRAARTHENPAIRNGVERFLARVNSGPPA
jgi:hypothetical protein